MLYYVMLYSITLYQIIFYYIVSYDFILYIYYIALYYIYIYWLQTAPPSEMPSPAWLYVLMSCPCLSGLLGLLLVIKHYNKHIYIYGWSSRFHTWSPRVHFSSSTLEHFGGPKNIRFQTHIKIIKFCPIHKPVLLGASLWGTCSIVCHSYE